MRKPGEDEAPLERVFAALRTSTPPAGMEERLLRQLAERDGGKASRVSVRSWLQIAAVAGTCGLAVVLFFGLQGDRTKSVERVSPETAVARRPVKVVPAVRAVAESSAASQGARYRRRGPARAVVVEPQLVASANHPAPPLPLTEQEKLLLRLAQGPDTDEAAALKPGAQDREMAEERKEFERFFAQKSAEEIVAARAKEQEALLASRSVDSRNETLQRPSGDVQ